MPDVPGYMADAARKGLAYRADGYGGDGLTEGTIREARAIADGTMSDDKVIRANAWGARHAVDLEAPQNSDSGNDDFPGAGAVAHYLWGIDPTDPAPARRWLEREAQRIQEAEGRSMETRHITVDEFEIREAGDGMSFTGYAAVFNSPSEPLPFTETIAPGAFSHTLGRRNNIRMLVNHNPEKPLASTRSKTLRLSEDSTGLLVDADLPSNVSYARDLSALLRAKVVDAMSFGFTVPRGGDSWSEDGGSRTLNAVRLHEVSVVTFPAYPATSASVRAVDALADKTGEDAATLNEALDALERGATLTVDQAGVLSAVVAKLTPAPEPQPEPEPEPVEESGPDVKAALDLLRAQIDLAYKAI
jgi:HK97 family phage prohead protease